MRIFIPSVLYGNALTSEYKGKLLANDNMK